jgi:CheY-like chemotaxis protein
MEEAMNEVIHADPVRIVQVLTNLLTNAAKYTDPGGTITIAAEAGSGTRTIRVSDTGIGVPREALQSVFDMFSQDKSVLERSEGGLGIGLALAKGLVELHDGTIEAFSEGPGRGTEFRVTLPSPAASNGRASGSGSRRAEAGSARFVLIADDNVDGAESLAELLRLHGNTVEVALDGESALQQARRAPPDVMILDIGMPGLNGYQVAQAVRQEAWGSAVRLVAVTGWGQNSDRALAYEAGFDEHLTKPCDPRRLLDIVCS